MGKERRGKGRQGGEVGKDKGGVDDPFDGS